METQYNRHYSNCEWPWSINCCLLKTTASRLPYKQKDGIRRTQFVKNAQQDRVLKYWQVSTQYGETTRQEITADIVFIVNESQGGRRTEVDEIDTMHLPNRYFHFKNRG